MSWGQFFSDAIKFRIPKTSFEGAAKGLIYAALLTIPYDLLFFPSVDSEIAAHSSKILLTYLAGVLAGSSIGATHQLANHLGPQPFR